MMNQPYAAASEIARRVPPRLRLVSGILLVGVVCSLSTALGFALKSPPHYISALWPTGAILFSVLVVTPSRHWWAYILAAYFTSVVTDVRAGLPAWAVLFIAAGLLEVLIAAVAVRRFAGGARAFETLRGLLIYIVVAVVLAPFLSAFVGALAGTAQSYWSYWREWFMSESLAFLTLAPAILASLHALRTVKRRPTRARLIEAGLIAAGLIIVSIRVFFWPAGPQGSVPALVYLPLPVLLWAAVRFGPAGVNVCLLFVALASITAGVHGHGPFAASSTGENVLSLQLFLFAISLPLMLLASLVAERRMRANALRESEARFRSMADTAPVLIWMAGPDKLCNFFNKTWLDYTRRALEKELGNGWCAGIHPADLARCQATYSGAFDARREFTMEYRLRRHDGEYRWILDNGVPRLAPDGTFVGYIGCAHDISERKLAELDAQRQHLAVDEALAFEELVAEVSTGFINLPPAQIDQFTDAALRRIVETLAVDRATLAEFSPDLGYVHFTRSWASEGVEPVARFVSTDLVPWARAKLNSVQPVVFARMDELPPEAEVDKTFWQSTGVRSLVIWPLRVGEELTGSLSLVCVRHERDWSETDLERVRTLASIFGNAVARKRATDDVERALRFERLLSDISASLLREPLRDPGEPAGRSLQAIGESLHAEMVALWRLGVEPDRLELEYSWPVEGSERMPQSLGEAELPWMLHRLLRGDIVSFSSSERLPPEASVDARTLDQRGVRSLLLVPVRVEGAVSGALSLASVSVMRGWPEELLPRMRLLGEMFAVVRARARASERLHEARAEAGQYRERLAHLVRVHTVGEMSTSIAHEINQPLVAIENYALAARRRLVSSGMVDTNRVEELLGKIAVQAARAGDVLKRLRSMLKKHEPQTTELDLGRLVSDTVRLVEIGGGSQEPHVEVVIAPDLPPVLADEIQIQQVVLNLARNALEAMEGPGVRSPCLTLDVQRCGPSDLVVRVVDNGPGVAAEETEHIFEPFYSTKDSGLGMGLAISRAIVAAHGGVLSCGPNPGGGSVFQFTLPAAGSGAAR
jgi:PAS domain S-box-containing protein